MTRTRVDMQSAKFPSTVPGPTVNGYQTTLQVVEVADLHNHPLRSDLINLINRAFSASHPPYLPASLSRLRDSEALESELKPDAFTILLTTPDRVAPDQLPRVLASVSARTFMWKDPATVDPVTRGFLPPRDPRRRRHGGAPDEYEAAWEMKHLVTEPALAGQGLASMLVPMVEGEMRRRWELTEAQALKSASTAGEPNGSVNERSIESARPQGKSLRIFLQTIKEINEGFYERRGYRTVFETSFDVGHLGSEAGFVMIGMTKDVE